ncbi:MAG TPA: 16S rRNA (guanine(527)-N(7))-methyltransferase RsmG [Thiolinea sp.]|nr:16S rRNA (guanine(527)-N(7))-methyltransferase RsmG [Thiolinea sp.]
MPESDQPDWDRALALLGVNLDSARRNQLAQYLVLLQRWNKVYNLTAVRKPSAMLPLHVWDSLSVEPFLPPQPCLDVGSGAGLPGLVLAIARPEQAFTLLDTNGKKTRFLQQAVLELGLSNVTVVHARIEQWQPSHKYASIISRAFAALSDFVTVCAVHLEPDGMLYAMKGRYPADELGSLPPGWSVRKTHRLQVPDLDAERHLLELGPLQEQLP